MRTELKGNRLKKNKDLGIKNHKLNIEGQVNTEGKSSKAENNLKHHKLNIEGQVNTEGKSSKAENNLKQSVSTRDR